MVRSILNAGVRLLPLAPRSNGCRIEQVNAYEAAFLQFYDEPWVAGMYWWFWPADPWEGGLCDEGYSPHDKPVENVLRAWYGGEPRYASTTRLLPFTKTDQPADGRTGPGVGLWSWNFRPSRFVSPLFCCSHSVSIIGLPHPAAA